MGERGAVGVHEPVVAIPDRHRVTERADDRVKTPLGEARRAPELLDEPLALALRRLALA